MQTSEIRALGRDERLGIARQLELYGDAPLFSKAIDDLFLLGGYEVNVLIEGETGTGKELFARALHEIGPRSARPFVTVNCAAIPSELLESEFFGHRRGAYTNAYDVQRGLVAEADGGTFFLDEVASLEWKLQAKLLRFLQSREYRPVGSSIPQTADTRIIAASNTPLREQAIEQAFRWDLYYRLAVFVLHIPPLRQRPGDVPVLAERMLARYATQFGLSRPAISQGAAKALNAYDWPGNVRELENAVQRALLLCGGELIGEQHLPLEVRSGVAECTDEFTLGLRDQKKALVRRFEHDYLENLLIQHQGNVTRAAQNAGKDRRALAALLKKHGIQRSSFVPHRTLNKGTQR